MAKKGNRVQVILECTEHKASGQPGTSRYITTKNKNRWMQLASTQSLSLTYIFCLLLPIGLQQ